MNSRDENFPRFSVFFVAARVVFENSVNSRSFFWGGEGGKNTFWMSGLPMFGSWIPSGACFDHWYRNRVAYGRRYDIHVVYNTAHRDA